MTELAEFIIHTTTTADSAPLCGAPDPGPVPTGVPIKILPCMACMDFGGKPLPEKLTMRFHLAQVRDSLRQKMRGMSEADRAAFKEQIIAIAASGLVDPPAAPAMYDEGQLLAALYAIGGIRAGFWQLKRAGIRPTWSSLERALLEHEMVTVALVEGTPM